MSIVGICAVLVVGAADREDLVAQLTGNIAKVDHTIFATKELIKKSGDAVYLAELYVRLAELYVEKSRYAFARLRFPGRDQIFLIYLSTMMIPFAVRMIPLFVLMRTFRWVDTLYALIVPGMFSAWGTFLMRQFMITIPHELEDAAFIDGAGRLQIYWRIIIPLTKPALATLGIFHFMGSWNAFLWPIVILSSMENRTLPLGLAAFQAMSAMKTPWHLVMAASVISVLPVLIIFILGQKYYVRGIVTTGLKG